MALAVGGLWGAGCSHAQQVAEPAPLAERSTATPAPSKPMAPAVIPPERDDDLAAMLRGDALHFDYDRADLTADDQQRLRQIGQILADRPTLALKLQGNCDERGTEEYNLGLGQERAEAAKKYLMNLGIDASRIATISYGKDRPLNAAHDEQAWAENRRDDVVPTNQR